MRPNPSPRMREPNASPGFDRKGPPAERRLSIVDFLVRRRRLVPVKSAEGGSPRTLLQDNPHIRVNDYAALVPVVPAMWRPSVCSGQLRADPRCYDGCRLREGALRPHTVAASKPKGALCSRPLPICSRRGLPFSPALVSGGPVGRAPYMCWNFPGRSELRCGSSRGSK